MQSQNREPGRFCICMKLCINLNYVVSQIVQISEWLVKLSRNFIFAENANKIMNNESDIYRKAISLSSEKCVLFFLVFNFVNE